MFNHSMNSFGAEVVSACTLQPADESKLRGLQREDINMQLIIVMLIRKMKTKNAQDPSCSSASGFGHFRGARDAACQPWSKGGTRVLGLGVRVCGNQSSRHLLDMARHGAPRLQRCFLDMPAESSGERVHLR